MQNYIQAFHWEKRYNKQHMYQQKDTPSIIEDVFYSEN